MANWATPEDIYTYWPSLANSPEFSDERIRKHIQEAEEIVSVDLEAQGFIPPFSGGERADKIIRRLVVLKALTSILLYPMGDGGNPSRFTRTASEVERRYQDELKWATRTFRALNLPKRTPWGPITG